MPPGRTRRTLVALAALALSLPAATGVAGALPAEPPPDWEAAEVVEVSEAPGAALMPTAAFPDVAGVDLLELGYRGTPLDASLLLQMGEPLPEDDDQARIAELGMRLLAGTAQRDGLVEAQRLLQERVDALGPDVALLREGLAVAERQHADAAERAADARSRLEGRTAALDQHRQDMAEVAVAAYVSPPDSDVLAKVLGGAATTSSDLSAGVLFSAKADHDGVVRDELEVSIAVARERLAESRAGADTATERLASSTAALADLEARAEAHRTALQRVRDALVTIEAQLPELKADMDRTIAEVWKRVEELVAMQLAAVADLPAGLGADMPMAVVRGIRIHRAIAPLLQALLDHAHADGVPLGGWGYRTAASQIELRRKHCGPTPEDIYLKKASQCSPPTAKPGTSMHERGLAVDFHLAGASISSYSSPGYQWLAQHAATYGFYNLPSEPWHWSVNAQ
jgi:hypothetical protein